MAGFGPVATTERWPALEARSMDENSARNASPHGVPSPGVSKVKEATAEPGGCVGGVGKHLMPKAQGLPVCPPTRPSLAV